MVSLLLALAIQVIAGTPTHIKSSAEFNAALRKVSQADSCTASYTVDSILFGTLTSKGAHLDSRGIDFAAGAQGKGVDVAWLCGRTDLEGVLNHGCCASSVRSLSQCFCKIAFEVGLRSKPPGQKDDDDFLDYSKLLNYVTAPSKNAVTNTTAAPGDLDLIVPTFENMVKLMPSTFPLVFASLPAASRPMCTPNATELVPLLKDGVKGDDSWSSLADDPANAKILVQLGATASTTSGIDNVTTPKLAAIGDALCTDVMAVRTYLWFALDANPLNLGDGVTSDGELEYITSPNPKVDSLSGVDQVALEELLPDKFCSSPDAVNSALASSATQPAMTLKKLRGSVNDATILSQP